MTGKELLPLIRSKGPDDRYSENLMKWVRKHWDRPMVVAFSAHCNLTGERLEYDATKTMPRQIIIGYGDMSDGWIHGRRLTDITGGMRGVFSSNDAYPPSFHLTELPDWWESYIRSGKCFFDPEHRFYWEKGRWDVSKDGKTRSCLWCGDFTQKLHIRKETIRHKEWRTA